MVPERSVLIVDGSEETREVLKTALERRGLRALATGQAGRGLQLARQHQPDLIVLDLEIDSSSPEDVCAPFAREAEVRETPLVLLGSVKDRLGSLPEGEFVSKPYHYGPLIRKIEELLEATGRHWARSA